MKKVSLDWLSSNCAIRSVSRQIRHCFSEPQYPGRDDRGIIDKTACCSVSGDEDIVAVAVLLLMFDHLQYSLLLIILILLFGFWA